MRTHDRPVAAGSLTVRLPRVAPSILAVATGPSAREKIARTCHDAAPGPRDYPVMSKRFVDFDQLAAGGSPRSSLRNRQEPLVVSR